MSTSFQFDPHPHRRWKYRIGAGTQPFFQGADTAAAFPWRLDVGVDDFALALRLTAMKPIVLHGDHGLSQKSEAASYWEGAVVVLDAHSGQVRGRGYLEMTGYEPAAWR